MSFNTCTQSHSHHHDQDAKYFRHPKKFLLLLCSQSLPPDPLFPGNYTVLPFLEYHIIRIVQYVVFAFVFFYLAQCFWNSSLLLHMSIAHSFLFLSSIALWMDLTYMEVPKLIDPLTGWWTLDLWLLLKKAVWTFACLWEK